MIQDLNERTRNSKPYVRWWWFGNAVSKEEIEFQLKEMHQQGIGGVEIQFIYSALKGSGVQGVKDIDWLSEDWVNLIKFTVEKAKDFGLNTDLTFGNGWPFGGPYIEEEIASTRLAVFSDPLEEDSITEFELEDLTDDLDSLVAVIAFNHEDKQNFTNGGILLFPNDSNNHAICWTVPKGKWVLYWFNQQPTGQMVKRAVNGGNGLVLDHLNKKALRIHSDYIISSLKKEIKTELGTYFGSFFADSWEVYGENWTSTFLEQFSKIMKYDLIKYLPLVQSCLFPSNFTSNNESDASEIQKDITQRIVYDYKKVHSDMIIENFFSEFRKICHENGVKARVQPYSAPVDLLAAYNKTDICEIEGFGQEGISSKYYSTVDPRLASSAAHIFSKELVSCESFTWLNEHFSVSLDRIKSEVDQIILHGVNKIIYHGSSYSPRAAGNPGWVFYASVLANYNNTWWPYFHYLNRYIEENSNLSQQGTNVADLLIYYNIHEEWMGKIEYLKNLRIELRENGHLADYDLINDEGLSQAKIDESGDILVGTGKYKFLILWNSEYISKECLHDLERLVSQGARCIFIEKLPSAYPGFSDFVTKSNIVDEIHASSEKVKNSIENMRQNHGNNVFHINSFTDLPKCYEKCGLVRDIKFDSLALNALHRKTLNSDLYFINNNSSEDLNVQATFRATGNIEIQDLINHTKFQIRPLSQNDETSTIEINIGGYESFWLKFSRFAELNIIPNPKYKKEKEILIEGPWNLNFKSEKNVFPKEEEEQFTIETKDLFDWSQNEQTKYFSGTATYRSSFNLSGFEISQKSRCYLEFEKVYDIADVYLNGTHAGCYWTQSRKLDISNFIKQGSNEIEIRVTNLLLNKVIGYDTNGVKWKPEYFFVDIKYKPLEAKKMKLLPAGITGKIKFIEETIIE